MRVNHRAHQAFATSITLLAKEAVHQGGVSEARINGQPALPEDPVAPQIVEVFAHLGPIGTDQKLDGEGKLMEKRELRVMVEHQPQERCARSDGTDEEDGLINRREPLSHAEAPDFPFLRLQPTAFHSMLTGRNGHGGRGGCGRSVWNGLR